MTTPPSESGTRWFYVDANNQPQGPVSLTELNRLYAQDIITSKTQVIEEGGTGWKPYCTVYFSKGHRVDNETGPSQRKRLAAKKEMRFRDWVLVAFLGFSIVMLLVASVITSCEKKPGADASRTPRAINHQANASRPTAKASATPFQLALNASAEQTSEGIIVRGTTNLPDSTILSITCSSEVAGKSVGGTDEAIVKNGVFSTVPFTYGDQKAMPSGVYEVSILMASDDQPASVQTVIGKSGRNLAGENIRSDGDRKWIVLEFKQNLQGVKSDELRKNVEEQYERNRAVLVALYRELISFRSTSDFIQYGFAPRGKSAWLKKLDAIIEKDKSPSGMCRVAAVNMQLLGLEYHKTHGEESRNTTYYRSEITRAIGALE